MKLFKNKSKKTKFRFLILVLFLLIGIIGSTFWLLINPSKSEAAWYSNNWNYRKQLVIDHTKVSGGSDLSNFPLLVSLSDEGLNSAQSSGNDILFTSSDGTTKLSHEIESFTLGTGTIVAWVKIPTLSASVDTVVYMYWGNAASSSQQDATNVWDTNYKAVWHLNQANGVSRNDSTSNANTLSENGTGGVGMGSANIDAFAIFKRASSQYLSRTNALQTGLGITGSITLQAWVNSNDITDASNNVVLSKEGSTSGNGAYSLRGSSSKVSMRLSNDGTAGTTANGATTLASNTWYLFAGTYDGTNLKVFLNGAQDASTAYSSGIFASTGNVNIGARNSGSNLWDGNLDEARVSNTARSAGWLATEYNNQSSPSTFFSAKTSEEKNAPVMYWEFDEGTGTTTNDSSANTNSGTLGASTAAPVWQSEESCISGKCLKFDGSNDFVSRAYSSDTDLDPGTASFSVSAWFRHPTAISGTDTLIARSNGATNGIGYKVYMKSTGVVCFGIDDDATSFPEDEACSTTSFADNNWHTITGVKSGTSSVTAYVDGKQIGQDATLSATGTLSGSSPTFYTGIDGDGSSNPWDGYVDEVKYYDYARSATQIKSEYVSKGLVNGASATFGSSDPTASLSQGLIGYWKMNEASWATDCSTQSVLDSSGNANNGAACPNASAAAINSNGKFANAGSFDGTNDYVSMGSTYTVSNTSMSISYWINPAALPASSFSNTILGQRQTAGNSDADFATSLSNSGTMGFYASTNAFATLTSCDSISTISTSTWSLYTAVVDSKQSKVDIYINGRLDKSCALAAQLLNNGSTSLRLGYQFDSGNEKYYNGKLDDVRIYNRSLSSIEVRALYDWAPPPLGYWKLDDKSGTSANDSSGGGYTGTLTNGPVWITGKYGGGITFDGVDDYVENTDTNFAITDNITMEAWVKLNSTSGSGNKHLIDRTNSNNGYALVYSASSDLPKVIAGNGTSYTELSGTTVMSQGTWYHLTGVITGTNMYLYVNGKLEASGTFTGGLTAASAVNFHFGARVAATATTSTMDDVKVYNYVRTPKQIVSDMNAGHPAVGSPVGSAVAWWGFDEGYGTTAHDRSITANDLTLSAASWSNSGKLGKAWNGTGSVWLTRADDDDLDFAAADDFTISTWFKSDSATNPASAAEYLLSKGTITNTGTAGYAIYANTSGNIVFGIKDDTAWGASSPNTPAPDDTATSTTDIYDGTWHHIVATKSGTNRIDLYVDGKLNASDTSIAATATLANSIALRVGDDDADSANSFNGDLDEMKIYRYALNADEVRVEYDQGKAQVLGSLSTTSGGVADNSSDRSYCVPGESATCSAPVGEWNMDEGSGTSTNDSSGSGLTGTLNTGPTWTRGKFGKGINFDASNDDVSLGTSSTLDFGTSSTLEAWIYPTSYGEGNYGSIIARSPGVGGGYEFEVINDGAGTGHTAGLDLNGGGQDISAGVDNIIALNTWQHVAVSIGSGTAKFYVNGKLVGSGSFTLSTTGANTAYIGSLDGNGDTFGGTIDQVKVYNYARSPSQIAWDYNRGGPVGWWKFDECTGSTTYDSSGSGLNGTWNGTSSGTYTSAGTCNSGTASEARNAGSTGKFGAAMGFDGTDDFIGSLSDNLDMGTSNFSIAAWMYRPTFTNGGALVAKKNGGLASQAGYQLYCTNGTSCTLYLADGTNQFTVSGPMNQAGDWEHIVAVVDRATNNNNKIYINGKDVTSSRSGTASSVNSVDNALNLRIGSSSNTTNLFDGLLDDVRIYNYVLTDQQIKVIYNENSTTRFGP